ncbi:hypothetical protein WME90_00645 [Sorangium sp. So ce375]|uniref:hypothetical protein n=1 Tax=Sorangium sp. So ce375 TaxID=3133306 RepID=UPI003F5B75C8
MKRTSNARTPAGGRSTLLVGFMLLAATGCVAADGPEQLDDLEQSEQVGETAEAITDGWTELDLDNGWENYWGTTNPPAIGKVDGIVTFRGALKATNPTSDSPFSLPSGFLPSTATNLNLRIVLSGGVGGTLHFDLSGAAHIVQDGASPPGLGNAAKTLTSLDGASFDQSFGVDDPLAPEGNWTYLYGHRLGGPVLFGAYVKNVGGFVRFQGLLANSAANDYDGFLFNLGTDFRPSNTVYVPADLGGASFGQLTIYPSGDVYVNGNATAAKNGTSLEGVWFSKTLSGNVALSLDNGWGAYSARSVKVGKYGGVVRFQGAISGGTSTTVGTLTDSNMWPPKTVYLVAAAYGPTPARIIVTTSGVVQVDTPSLTTASLFLSLDGVSFAL